MFNGISMCYLMAKQSLYINNRAIISPIPGRMKRVHAFPEGISLKINQIEQLEFELSYFMAHEPLPLN